MPHRPRTIQVDLFAERPDRFGVQWAHPAEALEIPPLGPFQPRQEQPPGDHFLYPPEGFVANFDDAQNGSLIFFSQAASEATWADGQSPGVI